MSIDSDASGDRHPACMTIVTSVFRRRTFFYRTYRAGEMTLEEAEALKLSYFTYPHLRALFLLAGLEPVAEYGSFAKAPLDNNA